jgi:hypothetical protein
MRTRLGWALAVLGVVVALLGLALALVLGPDSRFTTGPHKIRTDGIAVVTEPKVISWADVQIDLLAEVPVRKPVFVGLANSVDVQNYVGRTQRLEVTGFQRPWTITTRQVDGRAGLPGAPTAVDWWIAQSAGLGGASISTRLPDETVSAVVLSVGSTNLSGLEITLAYGIKGGFSKGIGLLLLGLGVAWAGWLMRRGGTPWRDDPEEVVEEEVVYVYVDEDGVEHEISAEEAAQYDVLDESVSVPDEPEPVDAPEPVDQAEPIVPPAVQVTTPGVLTAAQIAAETPEPVEERVVYVYVDEDGVEHEVSEDELTDFEIVDDEEDKP